jgi:predicted dehydrogenase
MKYNICLIGSGYWGRNYIKLLQGMNEMFNFVGIVEKSERIKNDIQNKYNIRVFNDIEDTFELCDCYIIATPVSTHFDLAKVCLENNKNIMVEKPLTDSLEKTKILTDLALEKNLKLMTNFTPIYTEPIKFIKNYIKDKKDKIRYISLRRSNLGLIRNDCDVILDLSCHDISLLLFLIDDEYPEEIYPIGKAFINKDVDMVSINMKYKNFIANIYTSRIDNLKQRELVIITEDERITYDDTNTANPITINNNNITIEDGVPQYNYNDTVIPHIGFKEPLRNQVEDFYSAMKENKETISTRELSLNVNKLIEEIYRNLK